MKRIFTSLVVLLAVNIGFAQTTKEVVDKYIAATGGAEKYQFDSYTYSRSYKANATTDYNEEVNVVKSEKKFSRKKSLMDRDFYYILNNQNGWIKIPMGSRDKAPSYSVKDLSAKEKSDLLQEANESLFGFVDFEKNGYGASGQPVNETLEGASVAKVVLVKGTEKKELFFDNNTGLLVKEVTTNNNVTHTYLYKKYGEAENGLKYPTEIEYINTKDKKKTIIATTFSPGSIKAGVAFIK